MSRRSTRHEESGAVTTPWQHRSDVSAWSRRLPVIALSLLGLVVAVTLTLFQVDAIGGVWEPFFGDGSRKVLTSSLSKALPVPDASLGAVAYAVEAVLEAIGGPRRALDHPWIVVAAGVVAAGLGFAALALIATQAFVVGAFCTLCLVSAAISLSVAGLVATEARTAVRVLRQGHHDD